MTKTGCDSLAIAIGTSHGAYKFKPGTKPQLRFDILHEVEKRLPGFPIVLHGASSVPQEYRGARSMPTAARCPAPSAFRRSMLREAATHALSARSILIPTCAWS